MTRCNQRASPRRRRRLGSVLARSLAFCLALASCGPGPEVSADGGGSESGTTSTDTSGPTDVPGSTGEPGTCWREVDGDFWIRDSTDLAEVAELRRVSGTIYIDLEDSAWPDMSALGCLEEAGGIMFLGCNGLPTTMGMSRLERLLSIVVRCSTLQVVEGFDGLDELWELEITAPNPQRISLPTLTRIEHVWYGACHDGAFDGALTSFGEFDSLASVDHLFVYSNGPIADLSILDALIANGAQPLQNAHFVRNPELPEAEILEKLEIIGAESINVCGNMDGVPCDECPVPG
jgi:hypothetical protein